MPRLQSSYAWLLLVSYFLDELTGDYYLQKFVDIEHCDGEFLAQVRSLRGHQNKVVSVEWNGHILTSGGNDKAIINHDGTSLIKSCHLRCNLLQASSLVCLTCNSTIHFGSKS